MDGSGKSLGRTEGGGFKYSLEFYLYFKDI